MLYHWGALIVPPGLTDQAVVEAGGNPYGTSHFGADTEGGVSDVVPAAAGYQGRRLARFADAIRSRSACWLGDAEVDPAG